MLEAYTRRLASVARRLLSRHKIAQPFPATSPLVDACTHASTTCMNCVVFFATPNLHFPFADWLHTHIMPITITLAGDCSIFS